MENFNRRIRQYRDADPKTDVEDVLKRLDDIVSEALGLTTKELKFMRDDLQTDPLFSRMEARFPFQAKTVRGLLAQLTGADRYQ